MAVDGLVKSKLLEAEGSKLKIPGFKAASGVISDEVKNRIVDAIKNGGTNRRFREELLLYSALLKGTRKIS